MERKREKGFTVIELLATLTLISLLAGMVALKYQGVVEAGKVKMCKNNLSMLNHAAELYYETEGQYPSGQQDLKDKGYIKEVVNCPVDGDSYVYDFQTGVFSCPNGH